MISARNHQPPLSGNDILVGLIVCLLVSSCSLFKPVQGSKESSSEIVEKEQVARIDTIVLTQLPDEEFTPILERSAEIVSEYKESYNIVLAGPFGTNSAGFGNNRIGSRSQRLLSFYLGFKYALSQSKSNSIINLDVFDTDGLELTPDFLGSTPAFAQADLYIGPYFEDNLRVVTQLAATRNRVVISPWNSQEFVTNRPNYVQMRPSLQRHCTELAHYARSRHPDEEILILTSDSERDQEIRSHIQSITDSARFHEFIISDLNDPTINDQFLSIWETDSIRGIILPVWSNEAFLVSILSKINFAKGNRSISVYGLPQWMNMERMDFDILENLEVFVSATRPLPRKDDRSKALVQYFFDKYGTLPDDEVFYGADLALWISGLLEREGSLITQGLSNEQMPGVRQQFDFIAKYGEDGEMVDYFSNEFITLYKFEDYQFSPVKGLGR